VEKAFHSMSLEEYPGWEVKVVVDFTPLAPRPCGYKIMLKALESFI
jgi:hypothetical protein